MILGLMTAAQHRAAVAEHEQRYAKLDREYQQQTRTLNGVRIALRQAEQARDANFEVAGDLGVQVGRLGEQLSKAWVRNARGHWERHPLHAAYVTTTEGEAAHV